MKRKIRKVINLFIGLMFVCHVVNAQAPEDYKNAITFGLTHGINNTNLLGDFPNNSYLNRVEETYTISRITPGIGINVDYYFSRFLSIQFEAVYSSLGCVVETNTTLYNEVAKIEGSSSKRLVLDYIKFPIAINVYPHEKFYFNGGGYVSTLVSSKERSFWYESDSKSGYKFNNLDYGIVAGAGLNLSYLKLGFQYDYGLANTIRGEEDMDFRNSVFQFVVRWKFYSEIRNPHY